VVVPPDGRIEFSPGGYHLMLMQLGGPLEEGDRIPVTLHFERAGAVEVELVVRALTAGAPADD
jgi:copper(I)-binding protein